MTEDDFLSAMSRIEELVARVEGLCSPESLPPVRELVQALLDVHRGGLGDLIAALADTKGQCGRDLVRSLADRPAVRSLLLMHQLHPDALVDRVGRAVGEANAALAGQARAELRRVDGDAALVSIAGSAAGVRLLRATLDRLVCEHAPDATLEIEARHDASPRSVPPSWLIPVERLRAKSGGTS